MLTRVATSIPNSNLAEQTSQSPPEFTPHTVSSYRRHPYFKSQLSCRCLSLCLSKTKFEFESDCETVSTTVSAISCMPPSSSENHAELEASHSSVNPLIHQCIHQPLIHTSISQSKQTSTLKALNLRTLSILLAERRAPRDHGQRTIGTFHSLGTVSELIVCASARNFQCRTRTKAPNQHGSESAAPALPPLPGRRSAKVGP